MLSSYLAFKYGRPLMNPHDATDFSTRPAPTPRLVHLFDMEAELAATDDGGDGPLGRRLRDAVASGSFAGPRLRGTILAGSADWRLLRRDGISVVDARVVLKAEDGAIIHMSYGGRIVVPKQILSDLRNPARRDQIDLALYSFLTTPSFETGSPEYLWMNDVVCIGSGRVTRQGVNYRIFQAQ